MVWRCALLALSMAGAARLAAARCGFVEVMGGHWYAQARHQDGSLWSFGDNPRGQLGDGTIGPIGGVNLPVRALVFPVVSADGGVDHACAAKADGSVWCWGGNEGGQLGNGSVVPSEFPVQALGIDSVVRIGAGAGHTLALRADATVWSWGWNNEGQLGDGSTIARDRPVRVTGGTAVAEIAGPDAGEYSMMRRNDGSVLAFGRGVEGQLGNGTRVSSAVPVRVSLPVAATSIATGRCHAAAVLADRTVWTWGCGTPFLTGRSAPGDTPALMPGIGPAVAVAAGTDHTLALLEDGTVWGWGENGQGELGYGTRSDWEPAPLQAQIADVIGIAALEHSSLALTRDGSVWAWGYGQKGALGQGAFVDSPVPLRVLFPSLDPIPGDQGNVLMAVRSGIDVVLDFRSAPSPAPWRAYRDLVKTSLGLTPLAPDAAVSSYTDVSAVLPPPALWFYRLKALSPCSRTPGP